MEYRLPGINQVQVNPKAGLTFAAALRSILRSDPDIVLIGEIRDHETAQIAIEAALTGHLVLSTLHTNDAPSAVTRLIDMGIEPFLVGSALDCVLAQRLARRLCTQCKEPYEPDRRRSCSRRRLPVAAEASRCPTLYRPVGLLGLRQDRLQGPAGAARGDGGDRGDRAAGRGARLAPTIITTSPSRAGHAHAARGRLAQGARRAAPRSRRSCASSREARHGPPDALKRGSRRRCPADAAGATDAP